MSKKKKLPEIEMWTTKELAQFLKMNESTIRKYVSQGIIPYYKFGEGKKAAVRFKKDEILEWIEKHKKG